MNELQTTIFTLLENATQTVKSAKPMDIPDLIEPHPDFPHCERFVVDLINKIKSSIERNGGRVSKAVLVNIYKKHNGNEEANESRTIEMLSAIS
jgi:hypothetical protein